MNIPSDGRTTEELLRCQAEEQLAFEALVADHPEQERALRRLRAELPVPPPSSGADSVFCLASDRKRIRILPDDDLHPGRHIGGFELIALIGSGGMGEVWEARQSALDRRVALKFIRSDHMTKTMVERFHVEARAGGRLNHPNIVALYDHGQSEGRYWIAQELVEGGCTLADTVQSLKEEERLPSGYHRKVAELFIAIADGLQAAHEAGVVHRDVKPQNILITPRDVPKVGDFGLARLVDDAPLTVGQAGGTPHYMSPEQIDPGPAPIDGRSDVFSLGAVLYELLTFRRAFGGFSSASVLHRIVSVDPEHPRDIEPRIPDELAVIAMAALEKRRSDRYQTTRELACDLRRFLRDEPILRKPDTVWMRIRKWARRSPARAVAVILGGLLVLATGVFGPAFLRQLEAYRIARKDDLLNQALAEIDHGRLSQAQQQIIEAQALVPDDPSPHVYLAAAFAQYSRFAEAEEQLAQARRKGLSTAAPSGDDAQEHLTYALFRMYDGKSRGWIEAERHLTTALELDPGLESALFPLYQLRRALDDDAGASQALERLHEAVSGEDDFRIIIEALLSQLERRWEEAVVQLEPLLERTDEEERDVLRVHRVLAWSLLRLHRWDEAEEHLELHLSTYPDDQKALDMLARTYLGRSADADSDAEARAALVRGLVAAEQAARWDPYWAQPQELAARIWLKLLDRRGSLCEPPPQTWIAQLRERLALWEEADPAFGSLDKARARLAFLLALPADRAGDTQRAQGLLHECLDEDPDHYKAATYLAQTLWERDDAAEEALGFLHGADASWTEELDRDWKWRLAIDVWTFGYADRAGDVELAIRSLRDARSHILKAETQWAEILSLAEFLALARTPELQDCAAALQLVRDWNLGAYAEEPGAEAILDSIAARCEL